MTFYVRGGRVVLEVALGFGWSRRAADQWAYTHTSVGLDKGGGANIAERSRNRQPQHLVARASAGDDGRVAVSRWVSLVL